MRVVVLLENTASSSAMRICHGLSLYIETGGTSFLLDMGPNAMFAQNAQSLGVDLSQVRFAVVSHGHYDHGGGVDVFLRRNGQAPVYIRPTTFAPHNYLGKPVGLRSTLKTHKRFCIAQSVQELTPNALLFSQVAPDCLCPPDFSLFQEASQPDLFHHEQNLLLTERNTLFLFAGCAHCGITAIVNRASQLAGKMPDYVFSGFHLANCQDPAYLTRIANALISTGAQFYTGHCTGPLAYAHLQQYLGTQLLPMTAGMDLLI